MANKTTFKKGERRRHQGGPRPGAGRPTKEEQRKKKAYIDALIAHEQQIVKFTMRDMKRARKNPLAEMYMRKRLPDVVKHDLSGDAEIRIITNVKADD